MGASAKPESSRILIDFGEGRPSTLLTVDPATKLLLCIEMKITPEHLVQVLPKAQNLSIDQFGWTSGAVATDIPTDRSFAFIPPKNFGNVESLVGPRQRPAVDEKVGRPAPNFVLTVLDGPRKTKTITKRPSSPTRSL